MTDPLALDPVLPVRQRSERSWNDDLPHDERSPTSRPTSPPAARSRPTDWMPDEYRTAVLRFVEMHANSELMGVLPEREWIMRAPTLRRKLALTAKVQDEVGHAQLLYRVAEDLGKPREQMLEDLIAGKTKFHNVFHYPTKSCGGDIGIISLGSSTPRRSSRSRRSATPRTPPTRGRCRRSAGRSRSTSCTAATSS